LTTTPPHTRVPYPTLFRSGGAVAHEFHEHADAVEPVESHPEASVVPGLQLACEGRSYGYGFGGEFGQVIVIISDMTEEIKPELSGTRLRKITPVLSGTLPRPCRHGCPPCPPASGRSPRPRTPRREFRVKRRCRTPRGRAAPDPPA